MSKTLFFAVMVLWCYGDKVDVLFGDHPKITVTWNEKKIFCYSKQTKTQ
jgi:hypothetical protein